jgi:O-antigen/teichoic acid export membrane protein
LSVHEANANFAGTEPQARPSLFSNSLLLALAFGALAAGGVATLVAAFPSVGGEVDRTILWIALGSIPLVILRLYLHFLAQADYHFGVTNVAWLLGPSTTVAVNGVLALTGGLSVGTALAAWIAGQALGLGLLIAHLRRQVGRGRPDWTLASRSIRFGAKAHIGRTMSVGHYRVDQWFVGSLAGSRELGLYSVATAWAEILSYLPSVLVLVQRPDLVRATGERAAAFAARVFRVCVLLTVPLAGTFIVAAPFFCVTVLGKEFSGAIADLRVLTLAAVGASAVELLGSALTAQRRPLLTTAAVGVAFVSTIVLNAVLVPYYGGLGAAIAAVIASTAGGLAAAVIFSRALGSAVGELVPRLSDLPWLWNRLRARFG